LPFIAARCKFALIAAKAKEVWNHAGPTNPLPKKYSKRKYKGFKDFLLKKETIRFNKEKQGTGKASKANSLSVIRAAFYTPGQAIPPIPILKANADKLNTIFPEWFLLIP